MTAVDQKEYLKKYLGIGKSRGIKKKRKKTENALGKRLKIIDDDIDVSLSEEIKEDLAAANEDAPQIVSIIDDRPPSMRVDEETKNKLWKPIGEVDSVAEAPNANFNANLTFIKGGYSNTNITRKSRKDLNSSSPINTRLIPKKELSSTDISPTRIKNQYSPERTDVSPPGSENTADYSPNRRRNGGSGDQSPRRQKNSDSENQSLVRRRNNSDSSPKRQKTTKFEDLSPRRPKNSETDDFLKQKKNSDLGDQSPRRLNNSDADILLSKRRNSESGDQSPKRRKNYDQGDQSPKRRKNNHQGDQFSKQRKNGDADDSPKRRSSVTRDQSPERKRSGGKYDLSPRRRKNEDSGYKHIQNEKFGKDTGQRKTSRWRDSSPDSSNTGLGKAEKTLSGKKSGLRNAKDLVQELKTLKERENEMFGKMTAEISGVNAATISRKKKTTTPEEDAERQRRQRELEEKYSRWGKGLKQVEDRDEKVAEQLHEMSKPLARYADDEDLEKYLKDQEREGDPMLMYMRKKKKKKAVEAGVPDKPVYMGDFMPNRYGIRPGYRWDGVDRSNGYEQKLFQAKNSEKASLEEALMWNTEDM